MAMRGQVLLTQVLPIGFGRREREREEKREEEEAARERESTFSLDFPVIRPSNPSETKDKVGPHCKSYAWVPVLWSSDNSGR